MPRFFLIFGLIALSAFSYAQYRGVGLFDDTASSQPSRLGPNARGTFHK